MLKAQLGLPSYRQCAIHTFTASNQNGGEYAVFYPSIQELHIVRDTRDMFSATNLRIVLHEEGGISDAQVRAMVKMYKAATDHNLKVIRWT